MVSHLNPTQMTNVILICSKNRRIHLSAIADFFTRNPLTNPESIALELENLRECIVLTSPKNANLGDVQDSYVILGELITLFREM